jgi:hypothetical protein
LLLISEKATEMVNILKGNIEDQNEKISWWYEVTYAELPSSDD